VHRATLVLGRGSALRTSLVRGLDVGCARSQGEPGRLVRAVLQLVHARGVEAQPAGVALAVQAPVVLARAASAETAAA
jgi:hypothetical protein